MKIIPLIKKSILAFPHKKSGANILSLAALLNLFSVGVGSAHDVTVNITGTITNTTCSVSSDSINKQVFLGRFLTAYSRTGDTSTAKSFTINLENCGSLAHGVEVLFSGTPDTSILDYFKLDPESTATGFAVKLMDENQKVIPVGSKTQPYYITDNAPTKSLLFYAQMVQVSSKVTSGRIYATATFQTIYP